MSELLPADLNIRVAQSLQAANKATLSSLDHLMIVAPAKISPAIWKQIPQAIQLQAQARRMGREGDGKLIQGRLSNSRATGITLARLPKSSDSTTQHDCFNLLKLAGKLAANVLENNPGKLGLIVVGLDNDVTSSMARAVVLALSAHDFRLPRFHTKKKPSAKTRSLQIFGINQRIDLERTLIECEATNLARWLSAMPPNKLTVETYRTLIKTLARSNGWTMKFLDEKALKQLGAGAFLAVSQGNSQSGAGIVHLQYRPPDSNKQPALALIGKGIMFDTGGVNLKPFKHMLNMHEDMGGSAVALATLQALTKLAYPKPVDCWLAITPNQIGSSAYNCNDVVTACNGTTIEVVHTDAEGRMVLADTLALAAREKPGMMIDFATLTGACVAALSERYSGVFSNRPALVPKLIAAGKTSGERVWPFPVDDDFDEDLESGCADVLQCSPTAEADHILATRFLKRFVPDKTPWLHVDLSAARREKGLAQVPSGVTGFGVRFTLNLLLDQNPGQHIKELGD